MSCSEFIHRFSDYFDGVGDGAFLAEAEAHLASCRTCRRYREVIERGGELFRTVPPVKVPTDFHPRLRHRIFHLADAEALARGSAGSATTAATILGMAILLTAVAWSPLVRSDQVELELAPIVVSRPAPDRTIGLRPPPVTFSTQIGGPNRTFEPRSRGLLEYSNALFWEAGPLFERYGPGGVLRQTGLD